MATTNITIRIDEKLKQQAEDLFSDLGMNLTTAFTVFAKQAVREQGIPFAISRETPNLLTLSAFEEGEKLLNNPKAKRFKSVDELFQELEEE